MMNERVESDSCNKCGAALTGRFCAKCGTPALLERIDGRYIVSQLSAVLNFDRGILYTIKELLIRPDNTVQEFITADRNRVVKPVIFIILTSLVYTLLRELLSFEDGYIYHDEAVESTAMSMFSWIQDNYGYGNLMMGVFIAFWTKVLFRKYGYNFFEILILLCFVMGIGMLALSVSGVIEGLTSLKALQFGSLLFVAYATWAIGRFFGKKRASSYFKAFAAYFLGMVTFSFSVAIIGGIIDKFI